MITWIFEEDSFVPCAKIKGNKKYSIIADHIGTPIQGYNETGEKIWERELDSYGKTRMQTGDEGFCGVTYQGQTYDKDIDLTYNRFRWYSQEEGVYLSQDPIGLAGGNPTMYGYVYDTNIQIDPFGLGCEEEAKGVTYSDDLVKAAQKLYPNKAGKIELHHPIPQYLGGAKNQALVPLDAAYHQQITNAFRAEWGYGIGKPSAAQLDAIMKKVYSQFPLPK